MSEQTVQRPGSVSFVVFLTWVVAIMTILSGILLLVSNADTLLQAGVNPANARTVGWVSIVIGLVIALFASALGHGSQFARIMISLLMVIRFVVGLFAIFVLWGTSHFWGAVIATVFALLILYFLWNAKASAFFASR